MPTSRRLTGLSALSRKISAYVRPLPTRASLAMSRGATTRRLGLGQAVSGRRRQIRPAADHRAAPRSEWWRGRWRRPSRLPWPRSSHTAPARGKRGSVGDEHRAAAVVDDVVGDGCQEEPPSRPGRACRRRSGPRARLRPPRRCSARAHPSRAGTPPSRRASVRARRWSSSGPSRLARCWSTRDRWPHTAPHGRRRGPRSMTLTTSRRAPIERRDRSPESSRPRTRGQIGREQDRRILLGSVRWQRGQGRASVPRQVMVRCHA